MKQPVFAQATWSFYVFYCEFRILVVRPFNCVKNVFGFYDIALENAIANFVR